VLEKVCYEDDGATIKGCGFGWKERETSAKESTPTISYREKVDGGKEGIQPYVIKGTMT
jgi:hypothetical protein